MTWRNHSKINVHFFLLWLTYRMEYMQYVYSFFLSFFFLKHLLPSKFRWSFSDSKILSNNSEQSNSSQFLPLLLPVQYFRKNKEIKTQSCCYCLLHVSKNLGKTRNSPLKVIRESPAYSWNRRGRGKRWQCS